MNLKKDQNLHHILVIDDEISMLQFMKALLSKAGHHIDTAQDGNEGLQKLQSKSYDVVITDYKMPGLTGAQVLSEIKKQKGASLPVIGMSGTPWLLDKAPFDAVISKPATGNDIFSALRRIKPPK